jgi:hypothetical protein
MEPAPFESPLALGDIGYRNIAPNIDNEHRNINIDIENDIISVFSGIYR